MFQQFLDVSQQVLVLTPIGCSQQSRYVRCRSCCHCTCNRLQSMQVITRMLHVHHMVLGVVPGSGCLALNCHLVVVCCSTTAYAAS